MQIRFACARGVTASSAPETPCSWCGFRAGAGHLSYAEADGTEVAACSICFAARHAKDADNQLFRLAWLPEISQPDLAHLARVMAVLSMRISQQRPRRSARTLPTPSEIGLDRAQANIATIMQGLMSRVRSLGVVRELLAEQGGSLDAMTEGQERQLLPGLRLVPMAFDSADINEWVDEGSLNGYGTGTLEEQGWFGADLCLVTSETQVAPDPAADVDFPLFENARQQIATALKIVAASQSDRPPRDGEAA